MDSTQYGSAPTLIPTNNAGTIGDMQAEQLETIEQWLADRSGKGSVTILISHHPFGVLKKEVQKQMDRFRKHYNIPLFVSGHTHHGQFYVLGGCSGWLELNVGSITARLSAMPGGLGKQVRKTERQLADSIRSLHRFPKREVICHAYHRSDRLRGTKPDSFKAVLAPYRKTHFRRKKTGSERPCPTVTGPRRRETFLAILTFSILQRKTAFAAASSLTRPTCRAASN